MDKTTEKSSEMLRTASAVAESVDSYLDRPASKKKISAKSLKTTPLPGKKFVREGWRRFPFRVTSPASSVGRHPLDAVEYVSSSSKIKDTDGRTVFEMKDVEVPAEWSQLAIDILVSKYFRKAGVPNTGHETSVRQVVTRITHTIRDAGLERGYFGDPSSQGARELAAVFEVGARLSPDSSDGRVQLAGLVQPRSLSQVRDQRLGR